MTTLAAVLIAVSACASCGSTRAKASDKPSANDPIVAAVGDIACPSVNRHFNGGLGDGSACDEFATSHELAGQKLGGLLLLGDLQYENGTLSDFKAVFNSTWGRLSVRKYPVPGNHEYDTPGADGYFRYFGAAAGDPKKGYYSFDIGRWHLIALNSNCVEVGGCTLSSRQGQWLAADLRHSDARCTLAYWHHPRFSSGRHYNETLASAFWRDLYAADADLVLVGHDHDYERFAPQDPQGRSDPARGIRQFVVGTGGRSHDPIDRVAANSEVRDDQTFGVLELTLHPDSYDWRFVPSHPSAFGDSGTGRCH